MHMLTVLYTGYNGYTIYETGTKNWSIEIFQLSQFMLAMTFKHIFYKKNTHILFINLYYVDII